MAWATLEGGAELKTSARRTAAPQHRSTTNDPPHSHNSHYLTTSRSTLEELKLEGTCMKAAAVGHLAAGLLGNHTLALRKLSGVSIAEAVTRFGFTGNFVGDTNEEILLWAGTTLKACREAVAKHQRQKRQALPSGEGGSTALTTGRATREISPTAAALEKAGKYLHEFTESYPLRPPSPSHHNHHSHLSNDPLAHRPTFCSQRHDTSEHAQLSSV